MPVSFLVDVTEELRIGFREPDAAPYVPRVSQFAEGYPQVADLPGHVFVAPSPGGGRLGADRPGDTVGAEPMLFPASLIHRKLRGQPTDFWWAEFIGGAMAPELIDGDNVLVDRRALQPIEPGMFALDEGIGLTARWVEYIPGSMPARYRVRCSDVRCASYDIAADDIRVLGRIVWMSRRL
jgi:hypothetical protein